MRRGLKRWSPTLLLWSNDTIRKSLCWSKTPQKKWTLFIFTLRGSSVLELMIQGKIFLSFTLSNEKVKATQALGFFLPPSSLSPSLSRSFRSLPGGQRSCCCLISEMFEEAPGNIDTKRRRQDPTRHVLWLGVLDESSPQRDVISLHSCRIISLTLSYCVWSVSWLKGWLQQLNGGLWDSGMEGG